MKSSNKIELIFAVNTGSFHCTPFPDPTLGNEEERKRTKKNEVIDLKNPLKILIKIKNNCDSDCFQNSVGI